MQPVKFICSDCKHFRRFEGECIAFPDGIPDEIVSGLNEHIKPLPGQGNGIVYEAGRESFIIYNPV